MKPTEDHSMAEFPEDLKEQIHDFEKFCEIGEREMSAKWRDQTFQSLMHAWENSENEWGASYEALVLRNRFEDIMGMIERNRIWPPPASTWSHSFRGALREVLSRLPQEAFDKVEAEAMFVLEERSLKMLVANAPAPAPAPSRTIVFFRGCMSLAPNALVGLIAHEIAHTLADDKGCRADAKLAENTAREWGFGAELDCYECERERLYPNTSGPGGSKSFTKTLFRP